MLPRNYWTSHEVDILKKLWNNADVTMQEIRKVFPKRTLGAIHHKAYRLELGPRPQTDTIDEEYLKKLYEVIEG